MKPGKKFSY